MKRSLIARWILPCLGSLVFVTSALAGPKGDGEAAKIIKEFDKDGNHRLDGEEVAAVQKAYEEKPNGPLREFDKNKNGKLEDREVFDIREPAPKLKKLKK